MLTFIKKTIFVSTLFFLSGTVVIGQTSINPNIDRYRFGIPEVPQNCEINAANIFGLKDLLSMDTNQESVFILIARLGSGETERKFNRRRLFNVSKRLDVPEKRIVVAEGERVNGFGRVEIYWKGEKIGILFAGKNRDLCVDCCGPDERYYPDKDEVNRKQKQSQNRKRHY